MSILLKLDKINIKGVSKIIKVPGFEELKVSNIKLFAVKYFIYKEKTPLIVRITSTSKSFSEVYSLDLLNYKMIPSAGFILKKKPDEKFIEFFKDVVTNTAVKPIKESFELKREYILQRKYKTPKTLTEDFGIFNDLIKFYGLLTGVMLAMSLLVKYRYYFIQIKNWFYEKYVSGPIEEELNQKLFGGQKVDEAAFKLYHRLIEFIEYTLREKSPAFLICGPPGTSKTYIVRRTLYFQNYKPRRDYVIEKGASLGIRDVFSLLYYNRKKILILDDFDTPLRNEDTINLLKSITDSYDRRIVSLPREKQVGGDEGSVPATPDKFEFSGKLIIVTNLTRKDINTALLSRIPTFEVQYNMKEILENIEKMLVYINPDVPVPIKQEVYEYVVSLYRQDKFINLDFRTFRSCVEVRVGNPSGWKEMVKIILNYRGK
jgi:hypothetical protein